MERSNIIWYAFAGILGIVGLYWLSITGITGGDIDTMMDMLRETPTSYSPDPFEVIPRP